METITDQHVVEHLYRGHGTVTNTPKICPFYHDWIETELIGTIINKASMCINYMKGENKEADYNTRHCGRILLGGHGTVTKHLRFVPTSMIGLKEKLLRRLCVPKQERTQ